MRSQIFARSERLSGFLRFVVEQTLAGGGDGLKEQVVAAEVYGRRIGFNAAEDPVVRNDARRLRDKLREYYDGFPEDPVTIGLPKGGYMPVFEQRRSSGRPSLASGPVPDGRPALAAARWRSRALPGALGLAMCAIMFAFWLGRAPESPSAVWPVVPVSSLPGSEGNPTLSPDGNFVAFSWNGADNSWVKSELLVKAVGREDTRILASVSAEGVAPAWSPDGKQIAFSRAGQGVFVISPLGGPERRVSESGFGPRWTPDSRSLLIRDKAPGRPAGILQIALDTLQRRQVTQAPAGSIDTAPDVSPDGRTLAFIRVERPGVGNVYVVRMEGGEPQRRTSWNAAHGRVVWTSDGRELVYDAGYGYPLSMWRVPAFGARPERGAQIMLPSNAMSPTL
ncbi:MAG: hypothetical protein ACREMQ_19870, partial [Longimicrobiales bacterium]